MKYVLIAVIAFILGVTSMALLAKQQARARDIRFRSDVVAPTAAAIFDVNSNLQARKITLVRKKLELLNQRYQEFYRGGPTPEIFLRELYELNEESQHPGGR